MKSICTFFFFLSIALLITSCKEKEPTPRAYPRVKTLEVVEIRKSGVSFQAEIIYYANSGIDDHGFVWGTVKNPTINKANQKSLGLKSEIGLFETTINSNLIEGEVYYVRAYAKNKDYVVYGKEVTFKSLGSLPPRITSFTPGSAHLGDTITIEGDNLKALLDEYIIKFDSVLTKVVSAKENSLRVVVPNDLTSKISTISLTLAKQTATSSEKFTLLGPQISSFSPASGAYMMQIKILGKGFSINRNRNIVKFGTIQATILQSSSNQVIVQVPYGLKAGPVKISITIDGQTDISTNDFEVLL
jgi:hypothetical protein